MISSTTDERIEQLAADLAAATGESTVEAVTRALEERLARVRRRVRRETLVAELLEIAEHCASLPVLDDRSEDEILGYDERGLPEE